MAVLLQKLTHSEQADKLLSSKMSSVQQLGLDGGGGERRVVEITSHKLGCLRFAERAASLQHRHKRPELPKSLPRCKGFAPLSGTVSGLIGLFGNHRLTHPCGYTFCNFEKSDRIGLRCCGGLWGAWGCREARGDKGGPTSIDNTGLKAAQQSCLRLDKLRETFGILLSLRENPRAHVPHMLKEGSKFRLCRRDEGRGRQQSTAQSRHNEALEPQQRLVASTEPYVLALHLCEHTANNTDPLKKRLQSRVAGSALLLQAPAKETVVWVTKGQVIL